MTLKQAISEILDKFDKGDYFDSHTVINAILINPDYRICYMEEYSKEGDISLYHAKIGNIIKGIGTAKATGENSASFNIYGKLGKNQLWQKI